MKWWVWWSVLMVAGWLLLLAGDEATRDGRPALWPAPLAGLIFVLATVVALQVIGEQT